MVCHNQEEIESIRDGEVGDQVIGNLFERESFLGDNGI